MRIRYPAGTHINGPADTKELIVTKDPASSAKGAGKTQQINERGQNKCELQFETEYLLPRKMSGEYIEYWFEPWTFRLADRCTYRPDYVAQRADGRFDIFECKIRYKNGKLQTTGDAAVKIRLFPEIWPQFDYYLAVREGTTGRLVIRKQN